MDEEWVKQPTIKVERAGSLGHELQALSELRARDEQVAALEATGRVQLSGALGTQADKINGSYFMNGQIAHSAAVYQKDSDPDVLLLRAADGVWCMLALCATPHCSPHTALCGTVRCAASV